MFRRKLSLIIKKIWKKIKEYIKEKKIQKKNSENIQEKKSEKTGKKIFSKISQNSEKLEKFRKNRIYQKKARF